MKIEDFLKKGQAALIVLLVVAVALGFGISIISQATTDIRISQQEQEAARAFNAAEAGIEEVLKDITAVVSAGGGGSLDIDDVKVNYAVTGENYLEGMFEENEAAQVILGDNDVTIEWVDSGSEVENPGPGDCAGVSASSGQTAASLLISVVDDSNQVRRVGINACGLSDDNGMSDEAVGSSGTDSYLRSYSLEVFANDVLARIRPIYNRTSLRVTGTDMPVQTYVIDSEAQAPTLESKAIEVTRTEPATPSVFDYVVFSGANIAK